MAESRGTIVLTEGTPVHFSAEIFFELIKHPLINPPGEGVDGTGFLNRVSSLVAVLEWPTSIKNTRSNEQKDYDANKNFTDGDWEGKSLLSKSWQGVMLLKTWGEMCVLLTLHVFLKRNFWLPISSYFHKQISSENCSTKGRAVGVSHILRGLYCCGWFDAENIQNYSNETA